MYGFSRFVNATSISESFLFNKQLEKRFYPANNQKQSKQHEIQLRARDWG